MIEYSSPGLVVSDTASEADSCVQVVDRVGGQPVWRRLPLRVSL